MASEFLSVLYLATFGIIGALPMILIPYFFAPKRPNPIKNAPYECGQMPSGEGKSHLMMQYYAYLLMFVVFDVMSIFLFSWGVSYFLVGLHTALLLLSFAAIVFLPMGYALYIAGKREQW